MLGHILYGTCTLTHGNLTFSAIAPFTLGSQVTLAISPTGASNSAVVTAQANQHPQESVADILITCPSGMSEASLIYALQFDPLFNQYLSVSLNAGADGTAAVVSLAKTALGAPANGLLQFLEQRTGLTNWTDRQLAATAAPVALVWILEAEPYRMHPDMGAPDTWKGVGQAGIAFQDNRDFHTQQVVMDRFRRALYMASKLFTHPDLQDIGPVKLNYVDELKDESANTTSPASRCRVVGTFPITWLEPGQDAMDIAADIHPFKQFQAGLFNEPLSVTVFILAFDCQLFSLTVNGQTTGLMTATQVSADEISASLQELSTVGADGALVTAQADGAYSILFAGTVQQPISFTGTGIAGNASVSIVQTTADAVPGDIAAVLDTELTVSGT